MAGNTQSLTFDQTLGYDLNPAQELLLPHLGEPKNLLVSFPTGAGKTLCINLLAHNALYGTPRKRLMYVAPMKALVEEKRRDWCDSNHPYNEFNVVIVTGDYVGTWEDDETIAKADIIVITPESLASRLRNAKAEKSKIVENVGLLVIDEIHLLDETGRGATLEAALLEFTTENPDVPILGLSATVPNVDEIGGWLDTLNNLPTEVIVSEWRPTKLFKHFYPISGKDWDGTERIEACLNLREKHPDKQFIYGVFAKAFGYKLESQLRANGYTVEFHNADRQKELREKIERQFRTEQLRDLVATKTLAVGMNLPAGHVVITAATDAGGDIKAYELNQFAGRAGRPQFETEGHAHFLIPATDFDYHVNRITNGEPVRSQLKTINDVALHFLGAIYIGRIHNAEDFFRWFKRTLRNYQSPIPLMDLKRLLDDIIGEMSTRGMVAVDEDGNIKLRTRGKVCAQMGIDPYYVFELICNFQKFLAYPKPNDVDLAIALGAVTEFYYPVTQKQPIFSCIAPEMHGKVATPYALGATTYYLLLKGEEVPPMLRNMAYRAKQDIDRLGLVLDRLNYESEGWKDERVGLIPFRVYYGVSADVAFLMSQGCTKALAVKMLKHDVRNVKDLNHNPTLAKQLCTPPQLKAFRIKV